MVRILQDQEKEIIESALSDSRAKSRVRRAASS